MTALLTIRKRILNSFVHIYVMDEGVDFMKIKTWHIAGIFFTVILGSILHFVYEWSGFYPLFGLIGSVNESVWEHLKLLYWPFLVSFVAELWAYGKNTSGFFAAKAFGIVSGMFFIVAAFYTYSGIVGKEILLIDIILFVIGAIVSYAVSYKYIKCTFNNAKKSDLFGLAVLFTFAIMFCIYSFNPPDLGIFCP